MPVFEPPIVYDSPAVLPTTHGIVRQLFKYYGPYARGRSVLKINGAYVVMDYPDQLTLAEATEVYLGGHVYVVSDAIAEELAEAGFGEHVAFMSWGELAGIGGLTWDSTGGTWDELLGTWADQGRTWGGAGTFLWGDF